MKVHELQEARANAVVAMRALSDLADNEKRDLNPDEDKKFATLKTEITDLDKKISRATTLAEAERTAPAIVHGKIGDGRFEERARDFSIVKAIRAALPRDLGGGDIDAAFEREISQEVARRSGRTFQGIAVPDEVFLAEKRTLLVGSSAAALYPEVHRDDLFIDRLRSALVCERLGATVLNGLVGTVDIPRQVASSTAQWVPEDGALTETDPTFDDVTLSPKTVGAMTSYSRRTLINASPSIEQVLRNDLAAIIANAIDIAAMTGDGTGNKPTGITHAGAAEITAATLDWPTVLNFVATVASADALVNSPGWALNALAIKTLRATTKVTDDGSAGFLMEAPNMLAGYPALVTSALPGVGGGTPAPATIIFGDWSSLLVGYWSGVDVLLNPYETTAYARGRVLIRAMRDVDVAVRHPQSFAFADDVVV